jgi:predicted adenylyl cyclase CyaB
MARNVELKLAIGSWDDVRARLSERSDDPPQDLRQIDHYYRVATGRLKLRIEAEGEACLIHYLRDDETEPRVSRYTLAPVASAELLAEVLEACLGLRGTVHKRREVFVVGRTRVNFDDVRGLGKFIEFEAVLDVGEHPENGIRDVERLVGELELEGCRRVPASYIDLVDPVAAPAD